MNDQDTPLDPERVLEQVLSNLRRDTHDPPVLPEAPTPAQLAPSFPAYRILGLIGRGGMGAVYRARHQQLDREVAIKIMAGRLTEDPAFAERFLREARALAMLDHPHILRVHDFGKADDWCFLVTEYVDGMNLRQMMELGRPSPEEVLRIVPQICEALHFAHQKGVVHRDIKPENILVDAEGGVKVADFGLAKLTGTPGEGGVPLTETRQVLGTPHYIAPEQMEHPTQVDHRADIFSLGVVFYEMLTGQLPIGRFEPPSRHSRVSPDLDPVVLRSLEHAPGRRYQSIDQLRSEVLGGRGRSLRNAPGRRERLQRRHRRQAHVHDRPILAGVLLGLGLVAILLTLVTGDLGPSYVGLVPLAAASLIGFRALGELRQPIGGLRLMTTVASAWLPVLLLANAGLAAVLEPFLATTPSDEYLGAWVWGGMFLIDLVVLVRLARRAARQAAPRTHR